MVAQKSKARAIKPFYDKQAKVRRKPDEVFDCTAKRLAEINATAAGQLAVKVQPEKATQEEAID